MDLGSETLNDLSKSRFQHAFSIDRIKIRLTIVNIETGLFGRELTSVSLERS